MSLEHLNVMAIGGTSPSGKSSLLLKQAVEMTGVEKARVLAIPTALVTEEKHIAGITRYRQLFAERFGLPFEVLHDFDDMPAKPLVDELIDWADLVYISGGDTKKMIDIWEKYGIYTKLRMHALGGLVLSGISAGAIAPFSWGHSDWRQYHADSDDWDFERVDGLGLINAAVTPHNNKEFRGRPRQDHFSETFRSQLDTAIGLGIDNFAGLMIYDGQLEVKQADQDAGVTLFDRRYKGPIDEYEPGKFTTERLSPNTAIPLSEFDLA